jgi:hypothetical protein
VDLNGSRDNGGGLECPKRVEEKRLGQCRGAGVTEEHEKKRLGQ